jgi:hypothetical protein
MTKNTMLFFVQLLNTVQLFHWNTTSYPAHKATDKLYKELLPLVDSFVEISLQKRIPPFESKMVLRNLSHAKFKTYIKQVAKLLVAMELPVDLANIRDEMVGQLHQFLYLDTLHG